MKMFTRMFMYFKTISTENTLMNIFNVRYSNQRNTRCNVWIFMITDIKAWDGSNKKRSVACSFTEKFADTKVIQQLVCQYIGQWTGRCRDPFADEVVIETEICERKKNKSIRLAYVKNVRKLILFIPQKVLV